jgi:PAS domain S-box-containing protein
VRDPGHDLLASILGELPVGVWVARAPSGEAVYANRAFERILGMEAVDGVTIEEAPSTYSIQDLAGAPYPVDRLPFSRALATGGPVCVDDLVIDRGRKGKVNVRAFATPLRDGAGAIALVIIAFIDISAEARAIAERNHAESQLRFAVHHAPVVLWATDAAGVVTVSEGAALKPMGLRSGQLVGQSIFELYGDNPKVLANHQRAMSGEQVSETVPVGGIVLDTSVTPARNADGEVTGVIGMATDVTERHRLQARIIQNDRVAAVGTLAASVAHEINNPLTYVLGHMAAVAEHLTAAADVVDEAMKGTAGEALAQARESLLAARAVLGDARNGAQRIGRIARDLHTFARPADEAVRPVALEAVIASVLQLVRKEIEARARLTVDLKPTLPVRGNEARLVQVVLNLLVNAWQALPEAHPDGHEIVVRTRSDGPDAIIEISDTGPGIPPSNRQRIFEPFFTTKEPGAGTGLGLFVCRNIVEGLGGQISVADGLAGGALFRVRLPTSSRESVAPVATPAPARPPPPPRRRSARVLIIDDDAGVARVFANALQDEFDVRTVLDGHEALHILLTDSQLDLVYCDLVMQGLSGMELYDEISRRAPDRVQKLVFMTGGAFTPRACHFVERLGDAIVYKPFDILAETRRRLS